MIHDQPIALAPETEFSTPAETAPEYSADIAEAEMNSYPDYWIG